jgi:hypothetical protein
VEALAVSRPGAFEALPTADELRRITDKMLKNAC